MDNKQMDKYLKKLEIIHTKKYKDNKNYIDKCKTSVAIDPKNYKIRSKHTLSEYFYKYGDKLPEGKLYVFKKDEIWMMNKHTTYWEIKNESSFVYFEAPKNLKPLWISLVSLLVAGAIAGGVTAGVLLNKDNGGEKPFTPIGTHEHWYEYTEEERWWEHCSNGTSEAAAEEDIGKTVKVTLNNLEHEVRLIDIDHDSLAEGSGKVHCTFEFLNVITDSNGAYLTAWNINDGEASKNFNFPNHSTLNTALQEGGDIYNMFPNNLINKIVKVTKYVRTSNDNGASYSGVPYIAKLFPIAHDEMTSSGYSTIGEGYLYTLYLKNNTIANRIKTAVNGSGEKYLLRTPTLISTDRSWYVSGIGSILDGGSEASVYKSGSVSPLFCI